MNYPPIYVVFTAHDKPAPACLATFVHDTAVRTAQMGNENFPDNAPHRVVEYRVFNNNEEEE